MRSSRDFHFRPCRAQFFNSSLRCHGQIKESTDKIDELWGDCTYSSSGTLDGSVRGLPSSLRTLALHRRREKLPPPKRQPRPTRKFVFRSSNIWESERSLSFPLEAQNSTRRRDRRHSTARRCTIIIKWSRNVAYFRLHLKMQGFPIKTTKYNKKVQVVAVNPLAISPHVMSLHITMNLHTENSANKLHWSISYEGGTKNPGKTRKYYIQKSGRQEQTNADKQTNGRPLSSIHLHCPWREPLTYVRFTAFYRGCVQQLHTCPGPTCLYLTEAKTRSLKTTKKITRTCICMYKVR